MSLPEITKDVKMKYDKRKLHIVPFASQEEMIQFAHSNQSKNYSSGKESTYGGSRYGADSGFSHSLPQQFIQEKYNYTSSNSSSCQMPLQNFQNNTMTPAMKLQVRPGRISCSQNYQPSNQVPLQQAISYNLQSQLQSSPYLKGQNYKNLSSSSTSLISEGYQGFELPSQLTLKSGLDSETSSTVSGFGQQLPIELTLQGNSGGSQRNKSNYLMDLTEKNVTHKAGLPLSNVSSLSFSKGTNSSPSRLDSSIPMLNSMSSVSSSQNFLESPLLCNSNNFSNSNWSLNKTQSGLSHHPSIWNGSSAHPLSLASSGSNLDKPIGNDIAVLSNVCGASFW